MLSFGSKLAAKASRTPLNRSSHVPEIVMSGPYAAAPAVRRRRLVVRMSKKTKKRKARLRRSKANHGKRPNMGRG